MFNTMKHNLPRYEENMRESVSVAVVKYCRMLVSKTGTFSTSETTSNAMERISYKRHE